MLLNKNVKLICIFVFLAERQIVMLNQLISELLDGFNDIFDGISDG